MKQIALALLAFFALFAVAVPAAADDPAPWPGAHWYLWKTDQGCLYYQSAAWSPAENEKFRRTWYFSITWEGSRCTPGKLINGNGTLVEVQNLAAVSSETGRGINRYQGTMVNGLWDGDTVHSDAYPRRDPNTYPATHYTLGCFPGMAGDKNNTCRPPVPPPAIVEGAQAAAPAPQVMAANPPPQQQFGGGAAMGAKAVIADTQPVSECVVPHAAGEKGNYGKLENKCGFDIAVRFCNEKTKDGSWEAALACTGSANWGGTTGIAAHAMSSDHVGGQVYWFACKKPSEVSEARYVPGKGITARCR